MTADAQFQSGDLGWHEVSRSLVAGQQAITKVMKLLAVLTATPDDVENAGEQAPPSVPTALEDMRAYLAAAARDLRAAAALNPRPMRTLDRDQAVREEWAQLRAELPVEVEVVQYVTLARLHSGERRYGEHIIVRDDLRVGRLHRAYNTTLCTTPSYTPDGPRTAIASAEDLYPTCPICLGTAYRVAKRPRSRLLLPNHRC